ncbi:hypothetical protein AB1K70_08085 [Bremerella sp. JC770]|uniref:hypothetical protein n=1 Tax=Bremerella sp. JC770 TaxID=3232137 RepID=UPI00345A8211
MEDLARNVDADLLPLVEENKNHLWIGENPPFDFATVDFLTSQDLRLSPEHHQQYDVVWVYEKDLADLPAGKYELVLDELVRCLGASGKLVIRHSQNDRFSNIRLKHFLGRRFNTRTYVLDEWQENRVITTVFQVERENLSQYSQDDWTFALITVGKRIDNVLAFLNSVRRDDPSFEHEIIICGPTNPLYEPFRVTYLPPPREAYRDRLAEISRKKNDIADFASKANLFIAHDRYRLDENFFSGFVRYGYDFDFVSVLQWYECGTRFPAYVAMDGPTLTYQHPIDYVDYSTVEESQYLNGGLLIAKTQTMRTLRFNDLLFWNQAEDVELSHLFRSKGLPPRINCHSSATTIGVTTDHTGNFLPPPTRPLSPIRRKSRPPIKSIRDIGRTIERSIRPYLKAIKGRVA